MLDDRSFAQPLSNRAVLSADGGASAFALTTDSAALSIGNNNAYLCSMQRSSAGLTLVVNVINRLLRDQWMMT